MDRLRLVVPVYNDWSSFCRLLRDIDKVATRLPSSIFVTAVNDGSTEGPCEELHSFADLSHLEGAEVLHLVGNVGHQRAIAIGLCQSATDDDFDAVVVMDADGEDPPRAIEHLLLHVENNPDFCVVAQRRKRTETAPFRLSYLFYKSIFRLVTGKTINFGNFSLMSRDCIRRLVMLPDLWNHLPSAILRSRIPVTGVPVDRGRRYAGTSKMNFTSLIVHGLSGISVYADTIFVRLLVLTVLLAGFGVLTVAVLLTLRLFFPHYATPGWATTVTLGLAIILLQVFLTALSSILMLLNNRVQRLVLPIVDFKTYVAFRELLFGKRHARATEQTKWKETLLTEVRP